MVLFVSYFLEFFFSLEDFFLGVLCPSKKARYFRGRSNGAPGGVCVWRTGSLTHPLAVHQDSFGVLSLALSFTTHYYYALRLERFYSAPKI